MNKLLKMEATLCPKHIHWFHDRDGSGTDGRSWLATEKTQSLQVLVEPLNKRLSTDSIFDPTTRSCVGAGPESSFLRPVCFSEAGCAQSVSEGHLKLLRNLFLEWLQDCAAMEETLDVIKN